MTQLDRYRTHLTPRQARVLELRLAGHSWRTIAKAIGINEATARGHHKAALDTIARHKETRT
jgi:DNA-binding CsgD family transcriptional regulator